MSAKNEEISETESTELSDAIPEKLTRRSTSERWRSLAKRTVSRKGWSRLEGKLTADSVLNLRRKETKKLSKIGDKAGTSRDSPSSEESEAESSEFSYMKESKWARFRDVFKRRWSSLFHRKRKASEVRQKEDTLHDWIKFNWYRVPSEDSKLFSFIGKYNWALVNETSEFNPRRLTEILKLPNFREDGKLFGGQHKASPLPKSSKESFLSDTNFTFRFSDNLSSRDFLETLGFSEMESWRFTNKRYMNDRFITAIKEAKVWANRLSHHQGLLLCALVKDVPVDVEEYIPQISEAVVNNRIVDVQTLYGVILTLLKMKRKEISIKDVVGQEKLSKIIGLCENDEIRTMNEYRRRFVELRRIGTEQAELTGDTLTSTAEGMIARLAMMRHPALLEHLPLLLRYIVQGLIVLDPQLDAAVVYFNSMISCRPVNIQELEIFSSMPVGRLKEAKPLMSAPKEGGSGEQDDKKEGRLQKKEAPGLVITPETIDRIVARRARHMFRVPYGYDTQTYCKDK